MAKLIYLILVLICYNYVYGFEAEEENYNQDINKNNCDELNNNKLLSNDTMMMIEIEDRMHVIKLKVQPCIDFLIKNGRFNNLDYYLTELSKRGIQFRESLQMSINDMRKNLDDLHNKFRFDDVEYQTIFPAFQWAQSMDDIFIELKFAHRHDTPGCLEMKNLNVDIGEQKISFLGYCVLGDIPIKIEFNIPMWKEITIKESTHSFGSVGRYQFTLKKKMIGMYWDKLLRDGSVYPGNVRVWFEMKAKYEEQLKKYEDQDEEDEFKREVEKIEQEALIKENEQKAKKKTKKKKKRSKKVKNDETTNEAKKQDL